MHDHGTKTTPVFLPADGEASWSLLSSSVCQIAGVRCQVQVSVSRCQVPGVRFQVPEFKFLGVMFQVHIADTNIAKIKIYFYFFRILADRFHPKMSFHHDCMATLIKFGQPEATLLKSHFDIGVLL